MASPRASISAAIRKLPLSLTRFAARGSSAIGKVCRPMAWKSGTQAATASAAPPTTMNSLAPGAPSGPPKTGAATNRWPASACAAGEPFRQRDADRAHGDVDRAGTQAVDHAPRTEHDALEGPVVRQH